jgi:ribonuclease PH
MNKPTNNNSANCPDESWDPLSFLNQAELKEFLEEKNKSLIEENEKKIDDDNPETISRQNFFLKVDCVTEASGSSYIEIGNCKILCSVFGPREIPRKDDYDFKIGNLNCEFRFASFSCFMQRKGTLSQKDQSLDEKNFSCIIEEALKPSILLHKYPKSQIDLYILCIQNDIDSKNILCASIIASSIAMANASIELYDLVASYTYIPVNLTIAYMPQLHQVTSLHFSNENNGAQLSVDLFKSHIKECIENCKKVYTYMKFVLLNGKDENENGQNSNGISHQEN